MGEASVRLNLDVVATADNLAFWEIDGIALENLLRQRLR